MKDIRLVPMPGTEKLVELKEEYSEVSVQEDEDEEVNQ